MGIGRPPALGAWGGCGAPSLPVTGGVQDHRLWLESVLPIATEGTRWGSGVPASLWLGLAFLMSALTEQEISFSFSRQNSSKCWRKCR